MQLSGIYRIYQKPPGQNHWRNVRWQNGSVPNPIPCLVHSGSELHGRARGQGTPDGRPISACTHDSVPRHTPHVRERAAARTPGRDHPRNEWRQVDFRVKLVWLHHGRHHRWVHWCDPLMRTVTGRNWVHNRGNEALFRLRLELKAEFVECMGWIKTSCQVRPKR